MSRSVEYASFLIRLWREVGRDQPSPTSDWHSDVEHIQTGEQWKFDTLEGLLSFLRCEAEEGGKGGCSERPTRG